ncbi:MAG: hypothetical protein KDC66_14620 [Phaeodactylibacter sp.]|nr:hypothetical protein [Phaeodactylibacter sp.]MCB9276941.1 hypothetical protein [Lewinellaceae bacterium]
MRNITLILLLLLPLLAGAQSNDNALNKGHALLIHLSYGGHSPGGDLAKRFGSAFGVGTGFDFITSESNWIAGLDFSYYFGSNVKEDVLASLRTPEGFVIGNNRTYSDIRLRMRGFYAGGHIGKLFGLGFANPRSGIRLTLGAGLLQHKVRIQDDPQSAVPQLSGDYKKGYDRLANGLAFTEFIGYQVLSIDGRINFYAGLEFTQGLAMSRRDYDFDTRTKDETKRLDLLYGLKAGWILPIYFGKGADERFY